MPEDKNGATEPEVTKPQAQEINQDKEPGAVERSGVNPTDRPGEEELRDELLDILWPMKVQPYAKYEEVRNTVIYDLSQLIFGSLLAAYILGFVTSAGGSADHALAYGLVALFISITFSYLTAGFYIHYHTNLMSMPTFNLDRTPGDFVFALVQGLFFGISMIRPAMFPILLSAMLLLAIRRQGKEISAVQQWFKEQSGLQPSGSMERDPAEFESKRANHSKMVHETIARLIPEWSQPHRNQVFGIIALLVIGVFYAIPDVWSLFLANFSEYDVSRGPGKLTVLHNAAYYHWGLAGGSFVITLLVIKGIHNKFGIGARFLQDKSVFESDVVRGAIDLESLLSSEDKLSKFGKDIDRAITETNLETIPLWKRFLVLCSRLKIPRERLLR